MEIVGVVGDARHQDLGSVPYADVYFPHAQDQRATMDLVVRTSTADPLEIAPAVRGVIKEINSEQLIWQTRTMSELVANSIAPRRFNMILLGTFAVVALLLAGIGIFGVMNYAVTQRTHEIGIRLALGAQGADVLKMVVGQGMWLALVGVGIGLAGAFAVTRLMASLLYGVSATDPLVFAGVALLFTAVAFVASYIPARRATRVDPTVALRYE
jgi:putative ABC transport system permease protein